MEDKQPRAWTEELQVHAVTWDLPGVPEDVRVWRLDLDLAAPVPQSVFAMLDDGELGRIHQFRHHADKVRFGITRAMLKRLLAGHAAGEFARDAVASAGGHVHAPAAPAHASIHPASAHDASAIALTYTDTERPVWQDSGLHFNVAHSDALSLIVVSDRRPVGIDVERRRDVDVEALAPIVLAAHERRVLEQAPAIARRDDFYRYWVCKEAALKATGRGIADALQRIEVRADSGATHMRCIRCADAGMADRQLLQSLKVRLLPLDGDYAGAVAWGPGADAA